ncbi:enoyl-CoA hydratase [Mycolicibacterium peregrinum]|uniref:enoyl-CoA hydratase/isomerase family protein n=1 Tax=Mycolicibacterium peregrinum TaxID=43304 RepID=UPI0007EBC130|nr:enoyl-CoA hydratase-related protein [Mycolicibacterium peregrinum]OBF37419.1 enoyl-CoA hydratase [Mycolicibacterium peregrinum]
MSGGQVGYAVDDCVATVTLDRPDALNALTIEMMRQLAAAIDSALSDDTVRAIVITGAGDRAFCAGGDMAELIPRLTAGELQIMVPDAGKRYFSDVFKPIIAAVNGICVGGGLEILLGTDLRIAADTAVFGVPEVRWGLIAGGGSHIRLPQQVPWAIAMQLLLTGDHIDAERAYQAGLVNEIASSAHVLGRATEIAAAIGRNAPRAVQIAKEIAVRGLANESAFHLEYALNMQVITSDDATEGPRAFTEKRAPLFTGK